MFELEEFLGCDSFLHGLFNELIDNFLSVFICMLIINHTQDQSVLFPLLLVYCFLLLSCLLHSFLAGVGLNVWLVHRDMNCLVGGVCHFSDRLRY